MSNSRINVNIEFPEHLDLNDKRKVNEYLNFISEDIKKQVLDHIRRNQEIELLKKQEEFLNDFFKNPRYIERLINERYR